MSSRGIEAVLLTGGASRRMGVDKASLVVDGVPMAERVARELAAVCEPVTVIGRTPIAGFPFLADAEEFAGPLVALSRYRPSSAFVFVASCDLPRFSSELVRELAAQIGDHEAAVPTVEGRDQPLCALYRAEAFAAIEPGERKVMAWIDRLNAVRVTLANPSWATNVNRPEDLRGQSLAYEKGG